MKKNSFYYSFCGVLLLLLIIFLVCAMFGSSTFGFDRFMNENVYMDYFADFINQVRLTYDPNVYDGAEYTLGERGLPPVQYVLLGFIGKIFNFQNLPTLFLNGHAMPMDFSKPIYISTYFMCSIAILLFVFLYEK